MRLVSTLNDQKQAHILSNFLASEGIENKLEITSNSDWGSSSYGDISCKIWILDEDLVPSATQWIEKFKTNPQDPLFKNATIKVLPPSDTPPEQPASPSFDRRTYRKPTEFAQVKSTKLTFYLLLICILLFFIDKTTEPDLTTIPSYLPATPLLSSPIKKEMLYDYPRPYELTDILVDLYGIDKLEEPQTLPPEGQSLIQQVLSTPYWQGEYGRIVNDFKDSSKTPEKEIPLFEKISQGEFWRLFTPCLLHNDILHILFNMLWLIVLGQQIEQRIKPRRFLLLILLTGIFSNTVQYLVSGPGFLGFSGVLCAMLTFIWMRQKVAAWEGYPLESSTFKFMMFFIFAMFFIQAVSFYLEIQHNTSISPGIANAAHLAGAFSGVILGRLSFFSLKT